VSVGKDFYELVTGESLVTGEALSASERVFAAAGVLSLGTTSTAKALVRAASRLATPGQVARVVAATRRVLAKFEGFGAEAFEKFLKHVEDGDLTRAADGSARLRAGLHTRTGLERFKSLQPNTPVERSVTEFALRNEGNEILSERLPNGVVRLQIPRGLWDRPLEDTPCWALPDGRRIEGIKTLWPESYSNDDVLKAALHVAERGEVVGEGIVEGSHRGVRIRVALDLRRDDIKSAYPLWEQ
jgi:hypothetical protein